MVSSRVHFRVEMRRCSLPIELWRVVFSYLPALELCRCMQVCNEWKDLIYSLDSTKWKELYFERKPWGKWKHPSWPNALVEPDSWRVAYKKHYLSSKLWLFDGITSKCFSPRIFKCRTVRNVLHVGLGKGNLTISGALAVASPFDKLLLYPGVYHEDSTIVIRCPVSIVGIGNCNSIIVSSAIDMQAATGKIENVTIRPSFSRAIGHSSVLLVKVASGYLQLEHCLVEAGYVQVIAPGSINVHSCSFMSASLCLKGVAFSSVMNCLFKPDRYAVYVEEAPVHVRVRQVTSDVGGWVAASNEILFEEYYSKNIKIASCDHALDLCSCSANVCASYFADGSSTSRESKCCSRNKVESVGRSSKANASWKSTSSVLDQQSKYFIRNVQGAVIRNVKIANGRGGLIVSRLGHVWLEGSELHNLVYGVRCLQSSKIVMLNNLLHSCETSALFVRDHSSGLIAGNQIFGNGEAGIDIRNGADPIIQHNKISDGHRSGIVVLQSGKGLIRENCILNNKEAGVYILCKGNPKVWHNRIWYGKAAGVAVTEEGCGHVSCNDICGMEWAGIDIRHGGNPVVSHNVIRKGHADGIVVGEGGRSILLDNDIEENSGCGIWILDGAHPLVHSNRVSGSGDTGIAIVANSDNEHEKQQLHSQFSEQEHQGFNRDIRDRGDSSEDEEFLAPGIEEEEPASRFVHVSRPEKKLAQIEANVIENNKGHGISYGGAEGVVIAKNKIDRNGRHGITLTHPSEIIVSDNSIRNSNLSGINIELGVCATVSGNGVYGNKEYGVVTSGTGTIQCNDVLGQPLPAVLIRSHGNPHVSSNRLHAWKHECIFVEKDARCLIEKNEFYLSRGVKDISLHPHSSACVRAGNVTFDIPNVASGRNLNADEGFTSDRESFNSFITSPRPLLDSSSEMGKSAPYYLSQNRARKQSRAVVSFACAIL